MKMHQNDVSNEELARMIAEGFENTATKDDIAEINQRLDNVEIKMDQFAYDLDVRDLKKRVTNIERKIGIK